jgi:hypothetical protein
MTEVLPTCKKKGSYKGTGRLGDSGMANAPEVSLRYIYVRVTQWNLTMIRGQDGDYRGGEKQSVFKEVYGS